MQEHWCLKFIYRYIFIIYTYRHRYLNCRNQTAVTILYSLPVTHRPLHLLRQISTVHCSLHGRCWSHYTARGITCCWYSCCCWCRSCCNIPIVIATICVTTLCPAGHIPHQVEVLLSPVLQAVRPALLQTTLGVGRFSPKKSKRIY